MQLDTNIVLQQKPAAGIDLASAFKNAAALRSQNQIAQENDIKLQQQQEDIQEQQKIKRAYIESNGDPEDWLNRAKRYGAGPVGIRKVETMLAEKRKEALSLDEADRKAMLERHDQFRAMIMPIDDEQDDTKAARMFAQAYQIADGRGLIDDKTKAAMQQAMPKGFDREAFKILKNSLTTGTKLMQEAEKETRAQATMLRAQSYAQNLQQRIAQTDFKNETERQKLELDIKEYERLLSKDTNMEEIYRMRLTQDLDIARLKIKVEREKEAGKNSRLDKTLSNKLEIVEMQEEGKNSRLTTTRESIERVKQSSGKSEQSIMKSLREAEEVAKRMPGWADMEVDQQTEMVDVLFEANLAKEPVELGTGEGKPRLLGLRSGKPVSTVKPTGKPAPVKGGAAPQSAPSAPAGRVYVTGPDGTGKKTLPSSQLSDYLKAYPKAKKL